MVDAVPWIGGCFAEMYKVSNIEFEIKCSVEWKCIASNNGSKIHGITEYVEHSGPFILRKLGVYEDGIIGADMMRQYHEIEWVRDIKNIPGSVLNGNAICKTKLTIQDHLRCVFRKLGKSVIVEMGSANHERYSEHQPYPLISVYLIKVKVLKNLI